MLTREENEASNALDREVESGQMKIRTLMKKFSENVENMKKAKEDICRLLGQSQTHTFLQVGRLLTRLLTRTRLLVQSGATQEAFHLCKI